MFGTCVAETILASVHVQTQKQAGHMDASDQIKLSQNILRVGGRPHMRLEPLEPSAEASSPVSPSSVKRAALSRIALH